MRAEDEKIDRFGIHDSPFMRVHWAGSVAADCDGRGWRVERLAAEGGRRGASRDGIISGRRVGWNGPHPGRSNKEVAALLDLGLSTVETHRANLMQKLNLHNTAEIVLYAVRKGIIV
jgi:hypothetical protein